MNDICFTTLTTCSRVGADLSPALRQVRDTLQPARDAGKVVLTGTWNQTLPWRTSELSPGIMAEDGVDYARMLQGLRDVAPNEVSHVVIRDGATAFERETTFFAFATKDEEVASHVEVLFNLAPQSVDIAGCPPTLQHLENSLRLTQLDDTKYGADAGTVVDRRAVKRIAIDDRLKDEGDYLAEEILLKRLEKKLLKQESNDVCFIIPGTSHESNGISPIHQSTFGGLTRRLASIAIRAYTRSRETLPGTGKCFFAMHGSYTPSVLTLPQFATALHNVIRMRQFIVNLAVVEQSRFIATQLTDARSNEATPLELAITLRDLAVPILREQPGVGSCKVIDVTPDKFPLFAGVAAGSSQEDRPVMLHLTYAGSNDAPVVSIGKGIMFDTGGINLKTGHIDRMYTDKTGAINVFFAFMAAVKLMKRGSVEPRHIQAFIPFTFNNIGSKAQHPRDIVVARNGLRVEVVDTDAEGRLQMADVITYAREVNNDKIGCLITMATLTGSAVHTFGNHAIAMMSSDEHAAEIAKKAGRRSCDPVWQLPVYDAMKQALRYSRAAKADIRNMPPPGAYAGASHACAFLKWFVDHERSTPLRYVHFDIAGVTFDSVQSDIPSGRGVPLLVSLLADAANLCAE